MRILRKMFSALKFLLILPLIILPFFLLKSQLFSVDKIVCKTQYGPCNKEDEERVSFLKGENLFLVSSQKIKNSLKNNFSNKEISIQKIFPKTIEVIIEKRKAVVGVTPKELADRGVFLLDRDGVILELARETALPVIILDQEDNLVVGGEVGKDTKKAVAIIMLVYTAQKANRAELGHDSLTVFLQDEMNVSFPLDKDPEILVGALQLIMARSKIEGRLPKSIDLRYSNPVLKY